MTTSPYDSGAPPSLVLEPELPAPSTVDVECNDRGATSSTTIATVEHNDDQPVAKPEKTLNARQRWGAANPGRVKEQNRADRATYRKKQKTLKAEEAALKLLTGHPAAGAGLVASAYNLAGAGGELPAAAALLCAQPPIPFAVPFDQQAASTPPAAVLLGDQLPIPFAVPFGPQPLLQLALAHHGQSSAGTVTPLRVATVATATLPAALPPVDEESSADEFSVDEIFNFLYASRTPRASRTGSDRGSAAAGDAPAHPPPTPVEAALLEAALLQKEKLEQLSGQLSATHSLVCGANAGAEELRNSIHEGFGGVSGALAEGFGGLQSDLREVKATGKRALAVAIETHAVAVTNTKQLRAAHRAQLDAQEAAEQVNTAAAASLHAAIVASAATAAATAAPLAAAPAAAPTVTPAAPEEASGEAPEEPAPTPAPRGARAHRPAGHQPSEREQMAEAKSIRQQSAKRQKQQQQQQQLSAKRPKTGCTAPSPLAARSPNAQ